MGIILLGEKKKIIIVIIELCFFDATSMRDPLVDICKRYPNQSGDETKAFIFLLDP